MSVLMMRRVSRTYGLGAAEVHALQDEPSGALDSVNGEAVMRLRQAGEDCPVRYPGTK
jgi:hypothetical protein